MKRIITSGPQASANVFAAVEPGALRTSRVTTPTCPSHSGPALSTVTCTSSPRSDHDLSSSAYSSWSGPGRRTAAPAGRTARAVRAATGSRGAAARARSRPRRSRRPRPRPPRRGHELTRTARERRGRWPGSAAQIASVASPTARTVWISAPGWSGSPLIEIGTSPAPPAHSIVNWPGVEARAARRAHDSSSSVHVSAVSRRLPTTSNGAGTIAPGAGPQPLSRATAVHVEQLHPSRLQPIDARWRRTGVISAITELVIGLALAPQAGAVELDQRARARASARRAASGMARTATTSRRRRRRGASRSAGAARPGACTSSATEPWRIR